MAVAFIAVEVSIPNPGSPLAWLFVVFALVLGAHVIGRGLVSALEITETPIRKTMYFIIFIIGLVLFTGIRGRVQDDPLIEAEINTPSGVTVTESPLPADHSHDLLGE